MLAIIDNSAPTKGLRQRLTTVVELLQLVADLGRNHKQRPDRLQQATATTAPAKTEQTDAASRSKILHDFRIACRRGETALRACRRQLEPAEAIWIRRHLHKMREACNALRDHEVLLKWLKKQSKSRQQSRLEDSLDKKIKLDYPEVSHRARKLIHRQIGQRIQAALPPDRPAPECNPKSTIKIDGRSRLNGHQHGHDGMSELCRRQLGQWLFQTLDRWVQNLPDSARDFDGLHQLRVATKRLRYGMEFVLESTPQLKLSASLKLLEVMQEKLGQLNDAVLRLSQVKQLSHSTHADRIRSTAEEELQHCESEWHSWWQPKIFKQILRQTTTELSSLLS